MRPDLAAYVSLTLLVLWNIADRVAPYHGAADQACSVGYVYDGDTVELRCGGAAMTARLQGLNTPETTGALCKSEGDLAARATTRLRALIRAGGLKIYRYGPEKYGRELVVITQNGIDLADIMVAEGLAEPYAGGRRRDWCSQ